MQWFETLVYRKEIHIPVENWIATSKNLFVWRPKAFIQKKAGNSQFLVSTRTFESPPRYFRSSRNSSCSNRNSQIKCNSHNKFNLQHATQLQLATPLAEFIRLLMHKCKVPSVFFKFPRYLFDSTSFITFGHLELNFLFELVYFWYSASPFVHFYPS